MQETARELWELRESRRLGNEEVWADTERGEGRQGSIKKNDAHLEENWYNWFEGSLNTRHCRKNLMWTAEGKFLHHSDWKDGFDVS